MTSFSGIGDSPARAVFPAFELSVSHSDESPCWDYIAAVVEIATSYPVRAMSSEKSKREIPGGLKAVLEKDVKLSKEFVELVNRKYPIAAYRSHLKSLEVRSSFESTDGNVKLLSRLRIFEILTFTRSLPDLPIIWPKKFPGGGSSGMVG